MDENPLLYVYVYACIVINVLIHSSTHGICSHDNNGDIMLGMFLMLAKWIWAYTLRIYVAESMTTDCKVSWPVGLRQLCTKQFSIVRTVSYIRIQLMTDPMQPKYPAPAICCWRFCYAQYTVRIPKINLLVRCLSHNFLLKFTHPIQAMQYRNVYTATRQNSQQFSSSSSPSQSTMPLHLHVALTHTWGWEGQYTSQPYSKAVAFVRQGLSAAGMRWQQAVSAYLQVHVIRTVMH